MDLLHVVDASIWGHRNMWLNVHAPWSDGLGYWDIDTNPNQIKN